MHADKKKTILEILESVSFQATEVEQHGTPTLHSRIVPTVAMRPFIVFVSVIIFTTQALSAVGKTIYVAGGAESGATSAGTSTVCVVASTRMQPKAFASLQSASTVVCCMYRSKFKHQAALFFFLRFQLAKGIEMGTHPTHPSFMQTTPYAFHLRVPG